jgi:hypothetical protein
VARPRRGSNERAQEPHLARLPAFSSWWKLPCLEGGQFARACNGSIRRASMATMLACPGRSPLVLAFLAAATVLHGCGRTPPADMPAGPAVTTSIRTGSACARDSDCGAANRCFKDQPGGYCVQLKGCGLRDDESCPVGTICSPLPWAEIPGLCLRTCERASDCRTGYRCEYLELFPGEKRTPRSPKPVCWQSERPL